MHFQEVGSATDIDGTRVAGSEASIPTLQPCFELLAITAARSDLSSVSQANKTLGVSKSHQLGNPRRLNDPVDL
jgi:hypothetical protein